MKKKIFIGLTVLVVMVTLMMIAGPNVVTGIPPVKEAGVEAIAAIERVAGAENTDSALVAAVDHLPVEGGTLEERIAHWVNSDFETIDSMKFKLVSGVGITATAAENKMRTGRAWNEVVVEIFSGGKSEEYFLECANGLVSKRWSSLVSEKSIGETRKVEHEEEAVTMYWGTVSENMYIPKGGSLCGTLGVTKAEALAIAKKWDMKYWYEGEKLYVLVYPNDPFHKVDGVWELMMPEVGP